MVSIPKGWRGIAHAQAVRAAGGGLSYRPGWRGTGQQPIGRVPVARYTTRVSGVPLNGGQAQGIIGGATGAGGAVLDTSGGAVLDTSGGALLDGSPGAAGTGTLTLSVGPTGMGVVWYVAQVTISTSTGALDTSTAQIYLGPAITPTTLIATIFSGNGTAAVAIPPMTPGQTLICIWTNGHIGDVAAFNVIGTQDALSTQ
jgi:hypothetical protein